MVRMHFCPGFCSIARISEQEGYYMTHPDVVGVTFHGMLLPIDRVPRHWRCKIPKRACPDSRLGRS